jgi:hypothetical protein
MAPNPSQQEAAKAVAEIAALLSAALTGEVSLGAKLKFVYPDAGLVMIDGTKTPNEVHRRDEAADCTVQIDPVLHLKMLRMEADQGLAFRQGKMRISGDVSVAVRLGPLVLKKINEGRP